MAAAFAFFAGISLPLGRVCLVAALVLELRSRAGRAALARAAKSPAFLGWAAFFVLAAIVSAVAAATITDPLLEPARGLRKLSKLAWTAGLLAVAAEAGRGSARAERIVRAFALGAAATGLWIAVAHPVEAWLEAALPSRAALAASVADPTALSPRERTIVRRAESLGLLDPARYEALQPKRKTVAQFVAAREALDAEPLLKWAHSGGWKADTFGAALAKRGTMADAQRLMLGALAALALCLAAARRGDRRALARDAAAGAVALAGLFATCKRGPIAVVAVVAAATILAARFRARRALLALALVALAALAVPQVRGRFAAIPSEFSLQKGGRARMWLVVAPELHRQYPRGIGFRSLTYGKMVEIDRARSGGEVRVEVGRTHVHSTPLQTWVDFGWPGPAVWALWMAAALAAAVRAARAPGAGAAALAAPAFLLALVLYSLVEYNLADSEIVLLYALSLGLAAGRHPS